MNNCFIILAAGESKRFKSNTPKPYFIYKGIPLILHSINKVKELNKFDKIIAVINKKHKKFIKNLNIKNVKIIFGGKNRAESSYKALMYLKNKNVSKVFIHDAARPNFSLKLLKKLLVQLKKNECVIPTLKSYDSTKLKHNKNIYNINRNYLHFVQTPQAFKSALLRYAYEEYYDESITDEASLIERAGKAVHIVKGDSHNIKVTHPIDLEYVRSYMRKHYDDQSEDLPLK